VARMGQTTNADIHFGRESSWKTIKGWEVNINMNLRGF
jgi:hypothetical protein